MLDLSDAAHGLGPWRQAMLDFAYLRPEWPGPFEGQILRAHVYFDPRGGLPWPSRRIGAS